LVKAIWKRNPYLWRKPRSGLRSRHVF